MPVADLRLSLAQGKSLECPLKTVNQMFDVVAVVLTGAVGTDIAEDFCDELREGIVVVLLSGELSGRVGGEGEGLIAVKTAEGIEGGVVLGAEGGTEASKISSWQPE